MIRDGWGSPNPVFRQFFTSYFIPDASPEIAASFDELQRIATSPENALRIWEMIAQLDVSRAGETGACPHSGASLQGRPCGAAPGGARYREAHPGRELHRAARKQSCAAVQERQPSISSSRRLPTSSRCMPVSCSPSPLRHVGTTAMDTRVPRSRHGRFGRTRCATFHARGHFSGACRAGSLLCWSIRRTVVRYHLAHGSRDAAPLVSSR